MELQTGLNGEVTCERYWDCECDNNYIHPKTEPICFICGCNADNMPDSLVVEVAEVAYQGELI